MDAKRKKILNEKGQGLVEFLLFLPLMLMLYSTLLALSNSINGSINQQKITRGYFYYRLQNNSTLPVPRRDNQGEPSDSWKVFGMQIMGWSEKLLDNQPVAPCYKLNLPFAEKEEDSCDDAYKETATQFIRVKTVYGVCGATYVNLDNYSIPYPRNPNIDANFSHCVITN